MKLGRSLRKERMGRVVGTRGPKTVLVDVERMMTHPLFGKVIRRSKILMAHDEKGECHDGDRVRLSEIRPLSRRKRWLVLEVMRERVK